MQPAPQIIIFGAGGGASGLPGATVDMNFKAGQYIGTGPSGLTASRASTAYANDSSGNWTSFASNTPRITNLGLLVEEARTNSIRNNSMQGAVVGTPGTLPTNWSFVNVPSGVTTSVVSLQTIQGIDTITLNFAGTPGANAGIWVLFDVYSAIAASNGQTWALSNFVSFSNITNIGANTSPFFYEATGGGGGLAQHLGLPAMPTSLTQASVIATNGNASTANLYAGYQIEITSGSAINFNVTLGWPQLELGASVTSPIRTTTTAATRAADDITLTSPPTFGSAYSVFAQGTPQAPGTYGSNQFMLQLDDGTDNNRAAMLRFAGTPIAALVTTSGGAGTSSGSANQLAQNTSSKVAAAVAAGSQAGVLNGGTPFTTAVALPIGVNKVRFSDLGGSLSFNGFLERIALWPTTRISNAQLQSMTQ